MWGLRGLLRGFLLRAVVVSVLTLFVAGVPVRVFAVATADEARAAVDGAVEQAAGGLLKELDAVAERVGRAWPRGVSAVEAVGEDREKRCLRK